jgi:hypothetical protein
LAKAASSGSVRCGAPITDAPIETCARIATARAMRGGLLVERGNGATGGVNDPPLAIVHHLGGKIGVVEPDCKFSDAFVL